MADVYMDDYFQEFSKYLYYNYKAELAKGDIESIYNDMIDYDNRENVKRELDNLFDLLEQTKDYHWTFTLQIFFLYYSLYVLGPKNVKLKWFKLIWDKDKDCAKFHNMPIQLECRRVYDLDESNFDGLTEVDLGEINFIRNIKLPSTIKNFKIQCIWDNRKYNIIDLSNVSKDVIAHSNEWFGPNSSNIKIEHSCITKVILPSNLEAIPNRFFSYCTELKEVTLPASLTEIDSMAFEGCRSLHEINYLGTKEQWQEMYRPKSWRRDSAIERVNCSDGTIILTRRR